MTTTWGQKCKRRRKPALMNLQEKNCSEEVTILLKRLQSRRSKSRAISRRNGWRTHVRFGVFLRLESQWEGIVVCVFFLTVTASQFRILTNVRLLALTAASTQCSPRCLGLLALLGAMRSHLVSSYQCDPGVTLASIGAWRSSAQYRR